MSYAAQLQFRQKQIDDENASSSPDSNYLAQLQTSVASLKKLNRFTTYRAKYQESFAALKAGTETAQQHLDLLKSMFSTTLDPSLREEIQSNIVNATADVKQYNDDILANQVKKAQYDGTSEILSSTIATIKDKRALAVINGNEDETSSLDVTLSVLNQQMNKVKIEDATDKMQIVSMSKGLSPSGKLQQINSEISGANNTDPVTINGKTYGSVADYWTQTRDAYLSGNGSGLFSDFFKELDNTYSNKINAAISRDGFATTLTLDVVKNELDAMKSKPEMAPFLDSINNLQSSTLAGAFKSTAQTIIDRASYNSDFKSADTALQDYQTKYNIDAQGYRLQLGDIMTRQVASAANANNISPKAVLQKEGLTNTLPTSDFNVPTPTTDVTKPVAAPGTVARVFTSRENSELTAAQGRIAVGGGSAIDKQNVAYATKQGWVATPVASVIPTTPVQPVVSDATKQLQDEAAQLAKTGSAIATTPPVPVAPTIPVTPASVVTPTPPKPVTGSVVDYLATQKQDTSFTARQKLAETNGITGYTGTAEQNTALLKKLQGGT